MNRLKGSNALAYAAGIVDGEGSICFTSPKGGNYPYHGLRVSVTNTNEWLINWFWFSFGGKIYIKPAHRGRKVCYQWQIWGKSALDFLKVIVPFLQIKRPQAELAIAFQERKEARLRKPRQIGSWRFRRTEEEQALDEVDAMLMAKYNHRGVDQEKVSNNQGG